MIKMGGVICDVCRVMLDERRISEDLRYRPHFCSMRCVRRSGVDLTLDGRAPAAPAYVEHPDR